MNCLNYCKHIAIALGCLTLAQSKASAQTEIDGIMMEKKNLCIGPMYSHSSWTEYWEGTNKRNNENLGRVTTQMFSIMGNYGITDKLNVLFGAPYVATKASAGTLHGMEGVQDLNLWVKWMPIEKTIGKGEFSAYAIGGYSFPLTNYAADFLPLSIGLRSRNLSLRAMADYQLGWFYVTASATYIQRSNIKIDRTAYYTTEMHLTNEVDMPDAASFNFRTGYRHGDWVAEAVVDNWTTLGGFDITRNNMPFPSNEMNATRVGVNLKYEVPAIAGFSLTGGGNYVVAGRNVGQATTVYGGIFYILNFTGKKASKPSNSKQN
ncbi:hypothetical protein [Paraflavitalea sp. CAU 1676]|uniref:hypothetical protein n=1 Tax=Paraflavitalea sp. CAU 1676 TaxID=3032598 RepID=UPI0023DB23E3|nr:hypothetical protein [Paraflavitalea sp. CAU 1676]MDF2187013.1 hypothetical protein [Paraflavitalea sp. CAU 1676]